jgi:hypothetical protein
MVHYKLIYFNLRGRGELARLVLHHQEVAFEDFRFEREEWPKYKAGKKKMLTNYNNMNLLFIRVFVIHQAHPSVKFPFWKWTASRWLSRTPLPDTLHGNTDWQAKMSGNKARLICTSIASMT